MLRSSIVLDSGRALARGATIATRYCAVRRQFSDRDDPSQAEEMQVLNYPMVQNRLFPLIATSFAMHITGTAMMALYQRARDTLPDEKTPKSRGDNSRQLFAELHATSCGLKALSTTAAAEGLEVARRACGGHGYSSFSGIGPWYMDYVPTTTWEGDNFMLTQQVGKYVRLLPLSHAVLSLTTIVAVGCRSRCARGQAATQCNRRQPAPFQFVSPAKPPVRFVQRRRRSGKDVCLEGGLHDL